MFFGCLSNVLLVGTRSCLSVVSMFDVSDIDHDMIRGQKNKKQQVVRLPCFTSAVAVVLFLPFGLILVSFYEVSVP